MKSDNGSNGFSVASLVLGILSLIIPYISTVLGILAIVFYKHSTKDGKAKAGLITGIIGLVVSILIWAVLFLVVGASL